MSKFLALTSLVMIATASAFVAIWPVAQTTRKTQAKKFITEASSVTPAEALTDYQLAIWLDPSNEVGYLNLAQIQVATGQSARAVNTLSRAGEGTQAMKLKVRTLLELGRYSAAADSSLQLARTGRSDSDHLLAATAYMLAGRTSELALLDTTITSPDALQRLLRIEFGNLPLAKELYAVGLPDSSRALLLKLPVSFERNFLLGQISYQMHSSTELVAASKYLATAASLNPADLNVHQLLAQVYQNMGLATDSMAQISLIKRLQNSRP
jgi:predicted Zn-dependent protease